MFYVGNVSSSTRTANSGEAASRFARQSLVWPEIETYGQTSFDRAQPPALT